MKLNVPFPYHIKFSGFIIVLTTLQSPPHPPKIKESLYVSFIKEFCDTVYSNQLTGGHMDEITS